MSSESAPLLVKPGQPQPSTQVGLTAYLAYAVFVIVLSSFQFGWTIGVINNPEAIITNCTITPTPEGQDPPTVPECIPMGSVEWAAVVAISAIGGMIGGLSGGPLADKLGRRNGLLFNNIFFIISAALMAFSVNFYMLAAGRFVAGIGAGFSTVIVPMYIGEVAPDALRGALGTINQLFVTVGILISQAAGLGLSTVPGWRWLLGIPAFTSAVQIILMAGVVDTPRWLAARGRDEDSRVALRRLRGTAEVEGEYADMLHSLREGGQTTRETYSVIQLFRDRTLHRALVIAYVLQLAQQFSGINSVFYYSTKQFSILFGDASKYVSIGTSALNVLMTIVAVWLMDRAGRRSLLLYGSAAMGLSSALIVLSFIFNVNELSVVAVLLFVASFAIALGPIPWLLMAEIFPTHALGAAASIGVAINWLSNFIVALAFPPVSQALGNYTYITFAAILAAFTVFTFAFIPETKGRSLAEISAILQSGKKQ